MMKKLLAMLTALTLLLGCVCASAGIPEDTAFTYVLRADGTVEITAYTGTQTEVTVPAVLDGHAVTAIGYQAFAYNDALTGVTIPAGVTSIENDAFFGCTALERVNIPAGVTAIGDYAFASCGLLTDVALPESVVTIGSRAFDRCRMLMGVSLPAENTAIGSRAFAGCAEALTIFVPPGSVTAQACQAQGVSVVEAEDAAVAMRAYVDGLLATPTPVPTATPTPEPTTTPEPTATPTSEPTPVPVVYEDAQNVRVSAVDVSLSDDASRTEVKTVIYVIDTFADGTCAVKGCLSDVKDLVIPEELNGYRVTVVKGYGFNDLRSITIPDSVTKIDDRAALAYGDVLRMDWSKLTVYASAGSEAERFCREHDIPFGTLLNGMAPVERGLKWSVYTYDLYPDNTCVITGYRGAFEQLEIPGAIDKHPVAGLGPGAFAGKNMTSAVLPDSVRFVAADAFEGCAKLRQVKVASTNPVFKSINGVLCRRDDGQPVLQGTNAAPAQPSGGSTVTSKPTATPTQKPTATPTQKPTATPTQRPTATPTTAPTSAPGGAGEWGGDFATESPVEPTVAPTPTPNPQGSVELPDNIIGSDITIEGTPVPTQTPELTPTPTPTVDCGDTGAEGEEEETPDPFDGDGDTTTQPTATPVPDDCYGDTGVPGFEGEEETASPTGRK